MTACETLTTLAISLGGGALIAVRALRHLQRSHVPLFLRYLTLPAACAADVALVVLLCALASLATRHISAKRSVRSYSGDIEESASLLKWVDGEEKSYPSRPGSPLGRPLHLPGTWSAASQISVSAASLLLAAICAFGITVFLAGVTVTLFENDSSGLPFDWMHFFEMRNNIKEGMRWIPVTFIQIVRGVAPSLACAILLFSIATYSHSIPPRLRYFIATVYFLLSISIQRLDAPAFRSRSLVVEAFQGYRLYARAQAFDATGELAEDAVFYGTSNIRAPSRAGVHLPIDQPRHVFHILLESASATAFPFSPTFCQEHGCEDVDPKLLTPEYFTPNYARFVNESFDAGAMMSSTSFSNKAHFTSMCGTMQELKDWTSEHQRPTALPCLPELLKTMDPSFATAAFSSGDAYWDHLADSLTRAGYDHIASKPGIKERGLPCDELAPLMCADNEMLPLAEEWIDQQLAKDARMMMSLVTINLHMEYYSPGEQTQYSKSPMANAYLNSLKWTDEVLGRFFEILRVRGLLENSMIVIHGDHSDHLSRRPDEYVELGPHEEIYMVPFAVRMPGGRLPVRLPEPARAHYFLDIVPTLLDAMSVSPSLIEHYHGRSLLREAPSPDERYLFTTESPGKTAIMLHDGPLKLARLSSAGYYCAVDRAEDPKQERPLCFRVDGEGHREVVKHSNTLAADSDAAHKLGTWVDEVGLKKLDEHMAVNARYWSDAAVESHEEMHRTLLKLAEGELLR